MQFAVLCVFQIDDCKLSQVDFNQDNLFKWASVCVKLVHNNVLVNNKANATVASMWGPGG